MNKDKRKGLYTHVDREFTFNFKYVLIFYLQNVVYYV